MKDPRLVGADVYVARLNNRPDRPKACGNQRRLPTPPNTALGAAGPSPPPGDGSEGPSNSPSTGSLYDELRFNLPTATPPTAEGAAEAAGLPRAIESRPCYRCVAYMHSVGIKRVFWTDSNGEWQGAKVRDLVDAMDGVGSCGGDGDDRDDVMDRVFVTKHEVLRLRKIKGI